MRTFYPKSKTLMWQRAAHVYAEARRVYEFKDTVNSDLRLGLICWFFLLFLFLSFFLHMLLYQLHCISIFHLFKNKSFYFVCSFWFMSSYFQLWSKLTLTKFREQKCFNYSHNTGFQVTYFLSSLWCSDDDKLKKLGGLMNDSHYSCSVLYECR